MYERDSSLRYASFRMTDTGMFDSVCLKKQSQFAGGQIGVSPYLKADYDIIPGVGDEKNKAKQSQWPGFARKS